MTEIHTRNSRSHLVQWGVAESEVNYAMAMCCGNDI